jgi:DsbC/DsbD-like thiol-disulfide interchange protein
MSGAVPGESRAQAETEASAWHESPHSRIRLLSTTGLYYQGKPVLASAIEIMLDKGWISYWRSTGEGLPPTLDWSASGNLSEATLLWPAPSRIRGGAGTLSAGYERQVVLPVLIAAKDTALPIKLNLSISYGICADICIPVDAVIQLEIPPAPHEAHRDRIRAALDRVPSPQEQGVYCPHSFIAAKRHLVKGRPALVIKTAFDENATALDLFVEGPEGQYLPTPSLQPPSSRGRSHYVMFFDTQAGVDALLGKTLILTTVSNQGSCESTWHVK